MSGYMRLCFAVKNECDQLDDAIKAMVNIGLSECELYQGHVEPKNLKGKELSDWRETVDLDEIRAHYYRTHPTINPSGLVAVAPAASFHEPHGREVLSAPAP